MIISRIKRHLYNTETHIVRNISFNEKPLKRLIKSMYESGVLGRTVNVSMGSDDEMG